LNSVTFSPDSRRVLLGGGNGQIEVYQITAQDQKAKVEKLKGPPRAKGSAASLLFSPDGETLYSAGGDIIHVWEGGAWRHRTSFRGKCAALSLEGKLLAVGGQEELEVVTLWRLSGPSPPAP